MAASGLTPLPPAVARRDHHVLIGLAHSPQPMTPHGGKRRPAIALAARGVGLLVLLAAYSWLLASWSGPTPCALGRPSGACGQRPQLTGYVPSTWEREFAAKVASGSASTCELDAQPRRINEWLAASQAQAAHGSGALPRSRDVFSSFEWTDECSGDTFVQHIEPLVGHFR